MELSASGSRVDIIFYTRQLHNGGVDRVVFNLADEFLRRGIRCSILVDIDNPHSPFRTLIPPGVGYDVLDAKGPLARLFKLRRYMRDNRPAALMCTSFGFPNLYAVVMRWIAGIPFRLMLTEHCFPSVDRAGPKPWQSRYWFFPLAHYLYPFADRIVAVSQGTALDLAKVIRIDPKSIACIYNPIVNDTMIAQSQEPVDHPWFAAGGCPVVIAVGRMEPQKNFSLLIRAFARVRAQMPARLVILGDGGERNMLAALVSQMGLEDDVALLGFVPNPHAYVAKATLMVLSSDFESLANVVIEAMAVGTPVVATDCPSGPAEALNRGQCGTLVPVGDLEGMSAAILDVLREKPAPVARSWLDQFSTRQVADRYLALLAPDAG